MNKSTDYTTLMHPSSEVGTAPTRCWVYADGVKPKLLDDGWFSFLFVLQGELVCTLRGVRVVTLTASQMMVVDKHQLRELQCVGDTVILEYVMSDKMIPLMQSTSRAFGRPRFEIITLNSKLQAWCRTMLTDLMEHPSRDNHYHHGQCSELTTLLLEYPPQVLGILYVPLYACAQHCKRCTKTFVRKEGGVS